MEIFAVVSELKKLLQNSRLQKIYQKENDFYLNFYREKEHTLAIKPNAIYLTNYKENFPIKPDNFCMFLRKNLAGLKLESIEQHKFERIVILEFSGRKTLIAELFAEGNIILTDENSKILSPLHAQKWKHRTIKKGEIYLFPPETPDLKEISFPDFSAAVKESKNDLVRTLAMNFGLGGIYAEEICAQTGINKNKKTSELDAGELEKIYSSVQNLLKEAETNPLAILKLNGFETGKFKTFNEVCDEFFSKAQISKASSKEQEAKEKLEKIIEKQRSSLIVLRKNIKDWQAEAEKLSIAHKFKESSVLFEKAKKSRKKIAGTEKAIKDIEGKIKTLKVVEKPLEKKIAKEKTWLDAFRVFRTFNNFLVVCGKDATTNDILVKKHTAPEDIVFHADIPGAAFCVIKTENKEILKEDLEEVSHLSAVYSKAWQRGLGAVDVYYVKPEQLSKQAPAGTYIEKGSFIVSGKKNYFHNAELKIAIGIDKDFNIISGAAGSIKNKTIIFSIVTPGNKKAKELAIEIKKTWAKKLPQYSENIKKIPLESIQKFIPVGKGSLFHT